MAARLLHSLTDENPDLQKQIGCMTGIFQLFDRQTMIAGGRRMVGNSPKRLVSGSSSFNDETSQKESNIYHHPPTTVEGHVHKNAPEKQRFSTESSRPSFSSSSRSSSFSSLDCNRAVQPEPVAFDRVVFPETCQQYGRQVLDIRDVVKESMNREAQVKQTTPVDLRESLRVLAKLREAPWNYSEPRQVSRSKDAPRFSYDGRESRQPKSTVKQLPRLSLDGRDSPIQSFHSESKCSKSPHQDAKPSVVAKLMGLETLPDSSPQSDQSTRWRNHDSAVKPICRFPVEPAPWKHVDKTRTPTKLPSVYCEIENRLKDLEFTESGKDLRALKQILEAMQVKGLLETQPVQSTQKASTCSNSSSHFESPIVIMKPAKLVEGNRGRKGAVSTETTKNQSPKRFQRVNVINTFDSKTTKSSQASARSKETTPSSSKTSAPISPRTQRSRPPTPPSDSNRLRKQLNKQAMESSSPGRRQRSKFSGMQQNDDQLSENGISIRSNGSVVSDSKEDIEVTSSIVSFEKSPMKSSCIQKRPTYLLSEDGSLTAIAAPEYPSPVSVLDNLVYADESPLSVKRVPDNRYKKPDRVPQCNPSDDVFCNDAGSGMAPEFNRRKLQNIENLVQKLRRLNSSHDEGRTDYIASLCENANPDHRYVSEILLASGLLLRDIGSSITMFQFHQSGLPINPELFMVLEQTKTSNNENAGGLKCEGKIHRKLVFDLVNEILATKLAVLGSFTEPWLKPQKLGKKALNAQKLLRELCSEIEQFQAKSSSKRGLEGEDGGLKNISWEDVLQRSESWTDFNQEVSAIVLDVERMVFKDLVSEVVRGEGDCLRTKASSRRRQLFTK